MKENPWPFYIQIGLIIIYLILAIAFATNKKTYPLSLYYVGCFVKDAAVFVLAWWNIK